MNLDFKGFKAHCHNRLMGGIIIHNNRHMTERETRILVNLAIEKGYKTLHDVPDEMLDEICNPETPYEKYEAYDDTPDFITIRDVKNAIRKASNFWYYDFDSDTLIADIKEELGL